MLDTEMSTGSTFLTFSPAPTTDTSIADELDDTFEDIDLSPIDTVERMESPKGSPEEIAEDKGRYGEKVPEKPTQPTAAQGQSIPMTVANADADSTTATLKDDHEGLAAENNIRNTTLNSEPKKSQFIEHMNPDSSSSQPVLFKDHAKLLAWKYNRELIERNADGFFKMETMPTAEQSEGIAALQGLLPLQRALTQLHPAPAAAALKPRLPRLPTQRSILRLLKKSPSPSPEVASMINVT